MDFNVVAGDGGVNYKYSKYSCFGLITTWQRIVINISNNNLKKKSYSAKLYIWNVVK